MCEIKITKNKNKYNNSFILELIYDYSKNKKKIAYAYEDGTVGRILLRAVSGIQSTD